MTFQPETIHEGLRDGTPDALTWIRERVRRLAAHRFSVWAWDRIEDDFVSDLVTQLLVTWRKPGFTFTGRPEAYVDRAIHNLCTTYYRRIARIRAGDPLDGDSPLREERTPGLEELAAVLDLRRALLELDAGCRRQILEKYILGWSLAEMAETRDIQPKTMRSRLHACREALRQIWKRVQHRGRRGLFKGDDSHSGGTP